MITAKDVKILVVDDDEALRVMLKELLTEYGFSVELAENGKKALEKLEKFKADVVLTDIRMPIMDGIALLMAIRTRNPIEPCVLVTSGYTSHQLDIIYDAGANGFFSKPFSALSVRDAIQRAFVPVETRWSQPTPPTFEIKIGKRYPAFEYMISSGEMRFGNGGFFIHQSNPNAKVGDHIFFSIHFERTTPIEKLEGSGIVRWVNLVDQDPIRKKGLGIEILSIKDPSLKLFCGWLRKQNFKSFIPRI